MRLTLLATFVFALLQCSVVSAQNFPLVDGLKAKTYHDHQMTGPYENGIEYQLIGDTVIQGEIYHKVYKTEECYWGGSTYNYYSNEAVYFGGVRQDTSGNMYHFPINLSNEVLTIDFSLQVGDTVDIWVINPDNGNATLVANILVDLTGVLPTFGGRRFVSLGGSFNPVVWIEGIGESHTFLPGYRPELSLWSEACFFENDSLIHNGTGFCYTCIPPGGDIAIEAIYPMPWNITTYYCDSILAPIFEFTNAGIDTIYSLSFSYGDMTAGGSYSWAGIMPPAASFIDTMPSYIADQGPHVLMIDEGLPNSLQVNGSFDSEPYNNLLYDTVMQEFYVQYTINSANAHPLAITVQPDAGGMYAEFVTMPIQGQWGWGNGWENFLYHYSNNGNQAFEYELCMNEDCFEFSVFVTQAGGWVTAISDVGDTIFDGYVDAATQNPLATICTGNAVLGVHELGSGTVEVYPNPTANNVQVRWSTPQTGAVKWVLFDLSGKAVKAGTLDETNRISIHDFSEGIYFFKFENERTSLGVVRLVKQ